MNERALHRPVDLHLDPDIRRAATLPSAVYTDPHLYQRSLDQVFLSSWQFLGDEHEMVKTPGAVWPLTLLPGSVDEPLVLTRDHDDRLHLMSNVCTHRGMLVAETPGRARNLRCRYHGRRFGLDGHCQHMPEFGDVEGFPCDGDHLPRLPVERWGRWLFTAAAPSPMAPFDEVFAPIRSRLDWLPWHEFTFDAGRSRDYLVRCHWALYVDNYLEGFHIPFVHASLDQQLDYGAYDSELFPWANLQVGHAAGGAECFDLPDTSPDAGQRIAAYYWWIFPNLMLNVYPWGLSVNVVEPLGVDRTRVSFLAWVWRSEKLDAGAGAGLDRVEREDEEVVEAVQQGVRSRFYDRGRYSPRREPGVHHFHTLLCRALDPASQGAG